MDYQCSAEESHRHLTLHYGFTLLVDFWLVPGQPEQLRLLFVLGLRQLSPFCLVIGGFEKRLK